MNRPQIFKVSSRLATAACYLGPTVMVAADLITIALNHTINPLKHTISGYAIGPYGWLEKLGMVTVAISFLLIALNLLTVKNQKDLNRLRLVGILLVIVAIGFIQRVNFPGWISCVSASGFRSSPE
ncbi:MAG: DUF998 domain-containing protein [Dehalococcoidales bacterium]